MVEKGQTGAEEVVRALAAAAAAVRLYPPTSAIPAQAIERVVRVSEAATRASGGPVRFVVEPRSFKVGDVVVAEGQPQVAGLAEMLYAHQVGQLIIAPQLAFDEVKAFVRCAVSDAAAVREEGGLRAVLVSAGVAHMSVIEMTLRASTEEGLAGLDLTSAPLEGVAPAVVRAVAAWARSSAAGPGEDQVAEAIGDLESATGGLAAERVAQALLRLDEQTRGAILAAAVRQDASGRPMQGMLDVIARMKPASLARLLTLAAARSTGDTGSLMEKLALPPEALRALELLLRTSPRSEADSGVPSTTDAGAIAREAAVETEEDDSAIRSALTTLERGSQAPRALDTTSLLLERTPDIPTIEAVSDALTKAVASGAFSSARAALDRLATLATRPDLEMSVVRARNALAQGDALVRGCMTLTERADPWDAASVLDAAGVAGAEAFLDAWLRSTAEHRMLLELVARALPDAIIAASGRRLRAGEPTDLRELIDLLKRLGDRRAVAALSNALDHPVAEVRASAIVALAELDVDEAWAAIVSMLTHPVEATARAALAAIRASGRRAAVPAMLAVLQMKTPRNRNQDLKREIIGDLRRMGATEALPALRRIATRRLVFRRKPRDLREAARRAVREMLEAPNGEGEKVDK